MKKVKLIKALFFVLCCSSLNVHSVFAAFSLDDYYPTGQGSSWAYDVTRSNSDGSGAWTLSEGENINGFETVRYPDGREYTGFKSWWWNANNGYIGYDVERLSVNGLEGIKWVELEDNQSYCLHGTADSTEPNQPIMVFPRTFDIGTQGDIAYKTYNYTHEGTLVGVTLNTEHYNVLGFEDVTVPAGNFNNALKLTFTEVSPSDGKTWVETSYFGRGVGEVKWEELTSYVNGSLSKIQTGVLTSYTVTPEPISCALFLVGAGVLFNRRRFCKKS